MDSLQRFSSPVSLSSVCPSFAPAFLPSLAPLLYILLVRNWQKSSKQEETSEESAVPNNEKFAGEKFPNEDLQDHRKGDLEQVEPVPEQGLSQSDDVRGSFSEEEDFARGGGDARAVKLGNGEIFKGNRDLDGDDEVLGFGAGGSDDSAEKSAVKREEVISSQGSKTNRDAAFTSGHSLVDEDANVADPMEENVIELGREDRIPVDPQEGPNCVLVATHTPIFSQAFHLPIDGQRWQSWQSPYSSYLPPVCSRNFHATFPRTPKMSRVGARRLIQNVKREYAAPLTDSQKAITYDPPTPESDQIDEVVDQPHSGEIPRQELVNQANSTGQGGRGWCNIS